MEDPWNVPPPGRVAADQAHRHRAASTSWSGSRPACPSSVDGESLSVLGVIQRLNDVVGCLRLGSHRHGREPAGRHQEPRDLRVPGQPGPDPRPPRPRGHLPRARPPAGEGPPRAPLRGARLRRALVQPAQGRPSTRSSPRASATSPARCACTCRRARCEVDRPAQPAQPLRLRAGHLRRRRQLPPRGLGRLRAPLGPLGGDLGRHPGPARGEARPGCRTLWHGRFEGGPADELLAFTVSLPFDQRLAPDDIAGSRAHVRGLVRAGILTEAERDDGAGRARPGRGGAGRRLASPSCRPTRTSTPPSSAGSPSWPADAAAKLHTGRSRNDQVATDLRLYTKRALLERRRPGARPAGGPARPGRGRPATPTCPGYTHLQRAQPVTLAHHLLAHGWALARDVDRLLDCRAAPTSRRSAPARWPARRSRSTPTAWPPTSASRPASRTASTPCPTATSWPRRCSRSRWSGSTSRASARRSCSGPARSSASPASTTPTPPAARCSRRRRTPTSPSWPAARPVGSSATSPACSPPSRASRSPTTATSRRTRSRCSTPSTRSSLALGALAGLLATDPVRHGHDAGGGGRRRTAAATDLAEHLVVSGHPVPGGARRGRRPRAPVARRRGHPGRAGRRRPRPRSRRRAALLEPGVAVTRRTTPGGGGPASVAVQLERFRRPSWRPGPLG